jgi:hypothetical protein
MAQLQGRQGFLELDVRCWSVYGVLVQEREPVYRSSANKKIESTRLMFDMGAWTLKEK